MLDFLEQHTRVRYAVMTTWSDCHPDLPGASPAADRSSPAVRRRRSRTLLRELRAPLATMMLYGGMSVGRADIRIFNATRSVRSALHRRAHARALRGGPPALAARHPPHERQRARRAARASLFERGVPLWLRSPLVKLVRRDGRVAGAIVRRDAPTSK
jgi:hypothetical protein